MAEGEHGGDGGAVGDAEGRVQESPTDVPRHALKERSGDGPQRERGGVLMLLYRAGPWWAPSGQCPDIRSHDRDTLRATFETGVLPVAQRALVPKQVTPAMSWEGWMRSQKPCGSGSQSWPVSRICLSANSVQSSVGDWASPPSSYWVSSICSDR
ncbi:unnamed protein product [Gadus morhua 'NCC']